jgi:adenylate cyclase, class 2
MPTNLEFKASVFSLDNVKDIATEINATHLTTLYQTDTYFNTDKGRLKLRENNDIEAQLIYYEREENSSDRWSKYKIYNVQDSTLLKELLINAYGIKVVVKKERDVFIYKNARIHADKVENLGAFLEFEVIHESDVTKSSELLDYLKSSFKSEINKVFFESYSDILLK